MESVLSKPEVRQKCQVFTPREIAQKLLKIAGYIPEKSLCKKKVLENSCGTGNILIEIVDAYINSAQRQGLSNVEIAEGLSNDIYGIELDPVRIKECRQRLVSLAKSYGIEHVNWKLINEDALLVHFDFSFDFIIGNPPYISYRELSEETRDWIKANYETCKDGKFDYCYAFLENSYINLSRTGKMVQLVPNNIYKNVYGFRLRHLLKDNLSEIYIYPMKKLFGPVLSSSSILSVDKTYSGNSLSFTNESVHSKAFILKSNLDDKKWIFSKEIVTAGNKRLGDFFIVGNAIATLCNEAFILNADNMPELEEKLLMKATSPKAKRFNKREMIIFPYVENKGAIRRIEEERFEKDYPLCAQHLRQFKKKLSSRKAEKTAKWYEYGRSQAIANMKKPKLMLSTVISNRKIEIYWLDKDTVPYTGIYIVCKDNKNASLREAFQILQSQEFERYIEAVGTYVNGNSIRISSRDIANFQFD